MDARKEFINAVMSVLRLEQNIYTVASIEEIIKRLEVKDYTMFIAYLGDRESDFEKPIQSITKAVDEFYEKKNKPKRIEILAIVDDTMSRFKVSQNIIVDEIKRPSYNDFGSKYIVDKNVLRSRMKEIKPSGDNPGLGFHEKSYPYATIEPLIEKCGGVDKCIDMFLDDSILFRQKLLDNSGYYQYSLPGITEKIEQEAEKDIDKNVLGHIKSAMNMQQII